MAFFSKRQVAAIALKLMAALVLAAAPLWAQAPQKQDQWADILEKMARENFGQLSAAERTLVRSAAHRELRWVGPNQNPDDPANDPLKADKWGPERCIRAGVLVWLISDSEAAQYVHPSGAGIAAARIIGKLDLTYEDVPRPLTVVRCAIPDGIDFSNASLAGLEVRASVSGAILGDLSRIKGDLALRFGHYGPVSIYRAAMGGDFDCSGSNFTGGDDEEVSAMEASIAGDAIFHQGFTTDGMVDFRLAKIGHSLTFNHARFIGGRDNGLNAERAAVDGSLYWVEIEHTARTQLDLENAHVSSLWDDAGSWPAPGNLAIDGFTYGGFGGDSPPDSESRLRWLDLQPPGYHPQPFAELARALKDNGRIDGEIEVLIAQRIAQRQKGKSDLAARLWNRMLQVTIGYGYRPLRALWWMLAFVLSGTVLFQWGYREGVMTPTEAYAFDSFAKSGAAPAHYPRFNALVYSLENFLPIVDLHQGNHWRPNAHHTVRVDHASGERRTESGTTAGTILRWYLWLHILAGWILTPLMFAGLSGLIRVE